MRPSKKSSKYLKEPTGIILPRGKKVMAHITGIDKHEESAGKVYVRWELWEGRKCIERAVNEKMHFYDPKTESREHCIRQLISRAEDAFRKEYVDPSNASSDSAVKKGAFTKALDSLDESEIKMLRKFTWGENTWKNYFSAFRRLLIDLDDLENYNLESLKKLRENMIKRAAGNKRSKGVQKASENVDKLLIALIYSLNALRSIVNEREGQDLLPEIPLYDVVVPGRRYQFEQIKWIPISVLSRLVVLLFARIESGVCMGIAAMLSLGLRTGECVAILIGELELIDGCMVKYKVAHQGPDRIKILKTDNAYRIVLAGKLFYDLIVMRIEYLKGLGYSDEEIKEMPLVSREDDPKKPIIGEKLSEMARNLLLEAGYCMHDMILASQLMVLEPDFEVDGSIMRSVSAYIFRRHFATMLCNCCDLFPDSGIEDYFLGHARKKPLPFDIKNLDIQREMVRKMERLVYTAAHTENPLYRAIGLSPAKDKMIYDLGEYSAYTFVAESEVEIEVIVQTREPNGRLYFDTDSVCNRRSIKRQNGKKDIPEDRAKRAIIPVPLRPEEFEKILSCDTDEKITEEFV